ncbi:hypothetical protein J6590_087160 [Homalodisca vitripennis]|nr:hypothetical protein J6590_087160 [Homalodisca vitripennis]
MPVPACISAYPYCLPSPVGNAILQTCVSTKSPSMQTPVDHTYPNSACFLTNASWETDPILPPTTFEYQDKKIRYQDHLLDCLDNDEPCSNLLNDRE